jgi:hypothetical protein
VGYTNGDLSGTLAGTNDLFVALYNTAGDRQWVKQRGVAGGNVQANTAVVSGSSIYLTGNSTGNFDGTAVGTQDAILVKYSTDGTWQWTQHLGVNTQSTAGNAITVNSSGTTIYVAGTTSGGFGGLPEGTWDAYVAKYDLDGNLQWTFPTQFGAASKSTSAAGVAVDSSGNIYVTGSTDGALTGNTASGASNDAYLAKINSSGTLQWIKQFGPGAGKYAEGGQVGVDSAGRIYMIGNTNGTLGDQTIAGTDGAFIASYDSDGNRRWLKTLSVASVETASRSMTVRGDNQIFMQGWTYGSLPGNTLAGVRDFFVALYDASGALQ